MNAKRSILIIVTIVVAGCSLPPEPTRFERACAAAADALRQEKVQIRFEDCNSGQLRGVKDDAEVSVNLRTLPDGSVRVELHTTGQNQALIHRISRAYDERMGR